MKRHLEIKNKCIIKNVKNLKYNEKELYDLMNKSEFWIYPTNFSETSCITAMEMLKSRVICLYYPIGGLVDTINGNGIQLIRDKEVNQIINLTEDEKIILTNTIQFLFDHCKIK